MRTGSWMGPPQGGRAPIMGPICVVILTSSHPHILTGEGDGMAACRGVPETLEGEKESAGWGEQEHTCTGKMSISTSSDSHSSDRGRVGDSEREREIDRYRKRDRERQREREDLLWADVDFDLERFTRPRHRSLLPTLSR